MAILQAGKKAMCGGIHVGWWHLSTLNDHNGFHCTKRSNIHCSNSTWFIGQSYYWRRMGCCYCFASGVISDFDKVSKTEYQNVSASEYFILIWMKPDCCNSSGIASVTQCGSILRGGYYMHFFAHRNTASGFCSMCSRIGGVAAPFIAHLVRCQLHRNSCRNISINA